MDSEIVLRPKKQDSMPDLFHNEVCSDSDPLNMSYPGLNYDLKDDEENSQDNNNNNNKMQTDSISLQLTDEIYLNKEKSSTDCVLLTVFNSSNQTIKVII